MLQKNPPMNGQSMFFSITNKYNNATHHTIQIEPNNATLAYNFLWVAWHLQNAAVLKNKVP